MPKTPSRLGQWCRIAWLPALIACAEPAAKPATPISGSAPTYTLAPRGQDGGIAGAAQPTRLRPVLRSEIQQKLRNQEALRQRERAAPPERR